LHKDSMIHVMLFFLIYFLSQINNRTSLNELNLHAQQGTHEHENGL
jgi:hypothetical protein